jgi:hypothetical protein
MIKRSNSYSGLEHVPACSIWPPLWLAQVVQPAEKPPAPSTPPAIWPSDLSPPLTAPLCEPPTPTSPNWNANRAAVVLADCNVLIDNALAAGDLTPPQQAVSAVLRNIVCVHDGRHDALLWEDVGFLTEQFAEWKAINAGAARTLSPAPSLASFQNTPRAANWWRSGDEPDLLALVKELFPPDGAAPKVGDWRSTRPGDRCHAQRP